MFSDRRLKQSTRVPGWKALSLNLGQYFNAPCCKQHGSCACLHYIIISVCDKLILPACHAALAHTKPAGEGAVLKQIPCRLWVSSCDPGWQTGCSPPRAELQSEQQPWFKLKSSSAGCPAPSACLPSMGFTGFFQSVAGVFLLPLHFWQFLF